VRGSTKEAAADDTSVTRTDRTPVGRSCINGSRTARACTPGQRSCDGNNDGASQLLVFTADLVLPLTYSGPETIEVAERLAVR
jgi:hypothetical protein